MEIHALRRLEGDVSKLVSALGKARDREGQLSAALVKSREEVERLRGELQRFKSERSDTRKTVDALIRRFDALEIDWDRIEP